MSIYIRYQKVRPAEGLSFHCVGCDGIAHLLFANFPTTLYTHAASRARMGRVPSIGQRLLFPKRLSCCQHSLLSIGTGRVASAPSVQKDQPDLPARLFDICFCGFMVAKKRFFSTRIGDREQRHVAVPACRKAMFSPKTLVVPKEISQLLIRNRSQSNRFPSF